MAIPAKPVKSFTESSYKQFMGDFVESLDFLRIFEECYRHASNEVERHAVLDELISDLTVKIVSGIEHLGGNVHQEVAGLISAAVQGSITNVKLNQDSLRNELITIAESIAKNANNPGRVETDLEIKLSKLEKDVEAFKLRVFSEQKSLIAQSKADNNATGFEKYRYAQQILAELEELLGDQHADYASLNARFDEIKDRYKPLI